MGDFIYFVKRFGGHLRVSLFNILVSWNFWFSGVLVSQNHRKIFKIAS